MKYKNGRKIVEARNSFIEKTPEFLMSPWLPKVVFSVFIIALVITLSLQSEQVIDFLSVYKGDLK